MFNQDQKKGRPKTADAAVTILTSGCHFNGKLYCKGASRIGGKIEGQIISEGLLIIEEEAVINAEIKADEAIIQGFVTGKLQANQRAELNATCKFEGDISTPCLVIKEGAQFNGRSNMILREQKVEKNPKIASLKDHQNNEKSPGIAAIDIQSKQDSQTGTGPEVVVKN